MVGNPKSEIAAPGVDHEPDCPVCSPLYFDEMIASPESAHLGSGIFVFGAHDRQIID